MSEIALRPPFTGDDPLRKIFKDLWLTFSAVTDETGAKKDTAAALDKNSASYLRAGAVLDKYGNSLLRVAYSYLHNMSDAEDVLQDTLIQYIRNDRTFESDSHEKAWLITVASNISKNKIKYNKLRETDELMEELIAEERQDLGFVWEAVKRLPDKYREVIHLFYQEEYSTKEIAEILERKEATVRSDLLRGREKLKEILKEAYDFE